MAEPRKMGGPVALTIATLAATAFGWLAMTVHEAEPERAVSAEERSLPPLPTVERAPRRPTPVAITRSSR